MPDESHYRGFRLNELYVIEVSWSEWSMHHLQTRTERHPDDPDEINIAPEWATEASLDPDGRLSLTRENDLRVTGWSPHAPAASWSQRTGRVLRVVLKPLEISEGRWSGFTAAPASQKAAEWYWRQRASFGPA